MSMSFIYRLRSQAAAAIDLFDILSCIHSFYLSNLLLGKKGTQETGVGGHGVEQQKTKPVDAGLIPPLATLHF